MQIANLYAIIALVTAALYLLGGVVVWLKRKSYPQAARVMLVYLFLSLLWAVFQGITQFGWLNFLTQDFVEQVLLQRIPPYGVLLLAIVFLALTRAFLRTDGSGWIWWLIGAVWAGTLIVLDANLLKLPDDLAVGGNIHLARSTIVTATLIAGWAVFMGGATVYTANILKRYARYYTAVSYWALVLLALVLGDGIFFANNPLIGNILHLAAALLAVFVVSAPRLPNINHLLRRGFGFLIFSVIATVVYSLGLIIAQVMLRSRPYSPAYAGVLMALGLVLLLNPLLGRLQSLINRRISGESRDPAHLLRQYSQSITNILDFQLLATVAVGTASEFLEVQRGFLFLVDHEKGPDGKNYFQLRGVKGMGDSNPETGRLREESPLAVYFRQQFRPLSQPEIDYQPQYRDITPDERSWMSSLGAEVYVPIYTKNEWIGLLALGPKGSGAAFTDQDLSLLGMVADQTAVALENTRLVEGLVRLNNDFRRAYSALDQANRHLERLDRTKSDFISIASHELRTPLTLISGSSQMLLDDASLQENPYYKQLLSKIHSGTLRLHEIVDSMLDMAKIDTRALELDTRPVSLGELITSICKDLNKASSERKQTVELENVADLPPIGADPEAMRKVFYHLIINAIKYTPDNGKITITGRVIEANLTDLPKGGVEIIVSDTGIGIDPRYQELIFAKFYQTGELALHSTGKTKFKGGGPGLGLAIARGIIQAHHGKIWVESPGYDEINCPGSQFHVVLPLRLLEERQLERAVLPSQSNLLKNFKK